MGLRGASSILYSITGLTLKALKEIARSRVQSNSQQLACINVDCSWVGHKLAANSSAFHEAGSLTAEVLCLLAQAGFIVTPICDPDCRHHSKRASIDRIAEKEKGRLTALCTRYKLVALSQKMRLAGLSGQEKEE